MGEINPQKFCSTVFGCLLGGLVCLLPLLLSNLSMGHLLLVWRHCFKIGLIFSTKHLWNQERHSEYDMLRSMGWRDPVGDGVNSNA